MDPQRALRFSRTSIPCPESGFTLVELMVALAIGLVLAGAILITQLKMTQQNATISDVFTRDTESRAAMDIISADVSGSGFLLGSSPLKCSVILNYDNAAPSNYFATFGVSALAGASGSAIPFIAGTGVSLTYPAGAGIRSDVLIVSGTANARNLTQLILSPNPTAGYAPTTTGTVPINPDQQDISPTYTAGLPVAGEIGILWLPSGTNNVSTCIRVPITGTGFSGGTNSVSSASGQFMPGGFYGDFGSQLVTLIGPTTTSMTDGWIEQGSLIDAGVASNGDINCQVCTTAYYVDQPAGASYPVLMKVTVNALDDVEIGAPQAVAAGVVSLQVAFGVDQGGTNGYVTRYYDNWASVLSSGNAPYVRSVKIAIISRSLQSDPNLNPQTTSTGSAKGRGNAAGAQFPSGADPDFTNYTGTGGSNLFTPYTLASQDFYHYYVQKTEIGVVKNCAANSAGSC